MRIKLKYPDVDTFIQKYSVNISRGGIFIATRTPKAVGTLVRFEFQLATSVPVIRGEGQVIWVKAFDPAQPKKVHGMGVRFTRLDSESRALVDRALGWKRENLQERVERPSQGDRGDSPGDAGPKDSAESESSTSGAVELGAEQALLPERVETSFSGPLPLPLPLPDDMLVSAPHELSTDASSAIDLLAGEAGDSGPFGEPTQAAPAFPTQRSPFDPDGTGAKAEAEHGPGTRSQMENEAVAELWQSSQSNIVRAARHIAELTAAHIYYPEDTELAELLKPLRIPLPLTGREASRLLAPLLDGCRPA